MVCWQVFEQFGFCGRRCGRRFGRGNAGISLILFFNSRHLGSFFCLFRLLRSSLGRHLFCQVFLVCFKFLLIFFQLSQSGEFLCPSSGFFSIQNRVIFAPLHPRPSESDLKSLELVDLSLNRIPRRFRGLDKFRRLFSCSIQLCLHIFAEREMRITCEISAQRAHQNKFPEQQDCW